MTQKWLIFKRNQNLLTKCEKIMTYFALLKIRTRSGYPGFLKSKPETRFFKTRPITSIKVRNLIPIVCTLDTFFDEFQNF